MRFVLPLIASISAFPQGKKVPNGCRKSTTMKLTEPFAASGEGEDVAIQAARISIRRQAGFVYI